MEEKIQKKRKITQIRDDFERAEMIEVYLGR